MRELCRNGTVVAAVITVLEKHNIDINKQFSSSTKTPTTETHSSSSCLTDENHLTCSSSETKNNVCLDDEISFESAVKDFNSVAEDVQKICTYNTLTRKRNNTTTDLLSQKRTFHDVEFEQNLEKHELGDNSPLVGAVYSDSATTSSSKKSSDSDEEREFIINDNLETISEEINGSRSYQGNYSQFNTTR